MSSENERPSFLKRLWSALGKTLRFLLFLAVLLGLAALIYYGTPYIYERVLTPLAKNTEDISVIQARQDADLETLTSEADALNDRLNELENRQTENAQLIASLEGQISALDDAVAKHTNSLKQLDEMQESIATLSDTTAAHEEMLSGDTSVFSELNQQIQLSRVVELISRGRLYLAQSNFGLAKADVQAARDLLAEIATEDDATFQDAITRLDMALGNLPDFPVVAIGDVDMAWQLLVSGLPAELNAQAEDVPAPEAETTPGN